MPTSDERKHLDAKRDWKLRMLDKERQYAPNLREVSTYQPPPKPIRYEPRQDVLVRCVSNIPPGQRID